MTEYKLDTERLRMRRLRLRYSQQRLGEMIGKDQGYISRLERGGLTDITLQTFASLAAALGVSMEYLVGQGKEDNELMPAAVA
jgi:transcriptional regulator with XRE-family HTH domain